MVVIHGYWVQICIMYSSFFASIAFGRWQQYFWRVLGSCKFVNKYACCISFWMTNFCCCAVCSWDVLPWTTVGIRCFAILLSICEKLFYASSCVSCVVISAHLCMLCLRVCECYAVETELSQLILNSATATIWVRAYWLTSPMTWRSLGKRSSERLPVCFHSPARTRSFGELTTLRSDLPAEFSLGK